MKRQIKSKGSTGKLKPADKAPLQGLPPKYENPSREAMFYEYIRESSKLSTALVAYLADILAIQNAEHPDPQYPPELASFFEQHLLNRKTDKGAPFPCSFPASLSALGIRPFPPDIDLFLILLSNHERHFWQLNEWEAYVWSVYFAPPLHHAIKARRLNPQNASQASYDIGGEPKGWRPMCFCINPDSTKDEILAELSEEIEWCIGDELVPIDEDSRDLLPHGRNGRATCLAHETWFQTSVLFTQWTKAEGAGATLGSAKERQAFQDWKRKHFANVVKAGRRGPKSDVSELPSPSGALAALWYWRILKIANKRSLRTVFELPQNLSRVLPYTTTDKGHYPDTGQIRRIAQKADRIFKILEKF